ncbi:hypothetical protein Tco_0442934 [Tanacetum coccineum]
MSSSKWEAEETSRSLSVICSIALRPTLHSTLLTLWQIEWRCDLIFSSFNTSNLNIAVKYGASSSQAQQMNQKNKLNPKSTPDSIKPLEIKPKRKLAWMKCLEKKKKRT